MSFEHMKYHHVNCECSDVGHSIRFNTGFDEEDPGSVELNFQLYQYYTLWDRIKVAVKYIFTGIGHVGWDSVLISSGETKKLIKYLQNSFVKPVSRNDDYSFITRWAAASTVFNNINGR